MGHFACCYLPYRLATLNFFKAKSGYPFETNQFRAVNNVAVDNDGNVYVVDQYDNMIKKFAGDGTPLFQFGGYGKGNGQFDTPWGVAVNDSGEIFVTDTYNHRIQKFNSMETFESSWGTMGYEQNQFSYPTGIAIDADYNVYVSDGSHRIKKFNSMGSPLLTWGSSGNGTGQLNGPNGIATDATGHVYVTDSGNGRVIKFTNGGLLVDVFLDFFGPRNIAVDASGNIFILDATKIRKLGSSGSLVYDLFPIDNTYGLIGIAVNGAGDLYVADARGRRILRYSSGGTPTATWNSAALKPGQLHSPNAATVDENGNLFVANNGNNEIYKFTNTNSFLTKWASGVYPTGITHDALGNLYVAASNGLPKFSNSGSLAASLPISYSNGIALDASGNLLVTASYGHSVQRFNTAGSLINSWGTYGPAAGQFVVAPLGIAVDGSGNVYVTDFGSHRIQKFSSSGDYLMYWGETKALILVNSIIRLALR